MPSAGSHTRIAARWREPECLFFVGLVLVVAPFVVGAVRTIVSFRHGYAPPSDWALLELRVRDVGLHEVFTGPYSRFGWFHPGPLVFYLLAVPYRLLGSSSAGLMVGALGINATAAVGAVLVARRRGISVGLATAVALALLMRALGPDFLRDPWNPHVPVLSSFLLLFLTWVAMVGDSRLLPWIAAVASFLVQTHVGFAPLAVAMAASATIGAGIAARRSASERRRFLRMVGIAALVALVLWLPTLWGEVVTGLGNLGDIVSYFAASHPGAGIANAARVAALQLDARPEWLFGPESMFIFRTGPHGTVLPVELSSRPPLLLVAALAAVLVSALQRRRDAVLLGMTVSVAWAVALLGVSRVVGLVYPYLVRWTWSIGAVTAVLVVWTAWLALRETTRRRLRQPLAVLAVGIVAAASLSACIDALRVGVPHPTRQAQTKSLSRQLLEHLPPGPGVVRFAGARGGLAEAGVVLQVERNGIPVQVAGPAAAFYGESRAVKTASRVRATVSVVSAASGPVAPGPNQRIVANYTGPPENAVVLMETPPGKNLDRGDEHGAARLGNPERAVDRCCDGL
ncbi:MAG TPA: hypothetical protein VFF40_08085 [Acidimicrobiia bacterium]|nr:hypothetical protein [Acidimicrobiia bacterium]